MRGRFTIIGVLLVVAAMLASAQVEAQRRSSNDAPIGERTLRFGGRDRTYRVHDFAGTSVSAPAVIVLHGGGGNAQNAVRMTGFDRVASRERFVVVYPNGTNAGRAGGNVLLTWNAGHCCASAMRERVDDVGFISAVIDALIASGRVDASRVYVTGMSNGAMLTHRLGRELSLKIAAIAPVVGAVFGDEPPPQAPVPAFIVVGADDQIVPPQGGPLQLRALLGNVSAADREVAPAIDQAAYWARHNGCGEPVRAETSASVRTEWQSCRSGAPVVFHSVKGNGHAWPGGEPGRQGAAEPSRAFDATAEMLAFFKQHHRKVGEAVGSSDSLVGYSRIDAARPSRTVDSSPL
jgi:polyhydroxybutyrate depolymerase